MSEIVESEYRGSPLLVIRQSPEDKFPFQFGVRKAKMILAHLDEIRSFITRHTK